MKTVTRWLCSSKNSLTIRPPSMSSQVCLFHYHYAVMLYHKYYPQTYSKYFQLRVRVISTSRDRPKSAPYPRLKNSKRTSKSQFTVLENQKAKKWTEWRAGARASWRAKRGTFPKLSTFLSQLKGGPFGEKTHFRKKVSQFRKTERGDPLGFLNTQSVVKYQRN